MSDENKYYFTGKIAVTTNDQNRVTGHIGKCKSFMVFDIDGETILNKELRENLFTKHRQQNHNYGESSGHNHAGLIEGLRDCKFLISKGGGWRVVEDLKQNNITTLFADVELIEDAVNKFMRNELKNEIDLICDHNKH